MWAWPRAHVLPAHIVGDVDRRGPARADRTAPSAAPGTGETVITSMERKHGESWGKDRTRTDANRVPSRGDFEVQKVHSDDIFGWVKK